MPGDGSPLTISGMRSLMTGFMAGVGLNIKKAVDPIRVSMNTSNVQIVERMNEHKQLIAQMRDRMKALESADNTSTVPSSVWTQTDRAKRSRSGTVPPLAPSTASVAPSDARKV